MIKKLGLLVLGFVVLMGCSSDDDGGTSQGIEGSWILTSFSFSSNYDFNNDGTALNNVLEETNCNMEDVLVFNMNGTGSINSDDTVFDIEVGFLTTNNPDGTITVTDIYEVDCDVDEFNATQVGFTWDQNGNSINILTAFQETFTLVLNGNELVSTTPDAYELPVIENGMQLENVIEDVTLVYTKQ